MMVPHFDVYQIYGGPERATYHGACPFDGLHAEQMLGQLIQNNMTLYQIEGVTFIEAGKPVGLRDLIGFHLREVSHDEVPRSKVA